MAKISDQERKQLAIEKAQCNRVPKEGVTIKLKVGEDIVFEGDFDAQLTPNGVVCVVELVPDLLNQNKGNPIPVIRAFVNADEWSEIVVK